MKMKKLWTVLFALGLMFYVHGGSALAQEEKGTEEETVISEEMPAEAATIEPTEDEMKDEESEVEEATEEMEEDAAAMEEAEEKEDMEEEAAEEATEEEAMVEDAEEAEEMAKEEAEETAELVEDEDKMEAADAAISKGQISENLQSVSGDLESLSASISNLRDQGKKKKGEEEEGNPLKEAYAKFKEAFDELKANSGTLTENFGRMAAGMEKSFTDWQTALDAMGSEKIKASGQKQRDQSMKAYENFNQGMTEIEGDLTTLLGSLGDVVSFLTFSLNPEGVTDISNSLKDAATKANAIKKDIDDTLMKAMEKLPESMPGSE